MLRHLLRKPISLGVLLSQKPTLQRLDSETQQDRLFSRNVVFVSTAFLRSLRLISVRVPSQGKNSRQHA